MTTTVEPRLVILTPTQRAVLGQLTHDGAENVTIAARLGMSENTVKSHVKGILKAFDCTNRTAVVTDCLRGRVQVRVENRSGDHLRKTTT